MPERIAFAPSLRRSAVTMNCWRRPAWMRFIFRCRPACARNGCCARRRRASTSSAKSRARSMQPISKKCWRRAGSIRVQFMDGVMFMHNPRLARVREILDDGKSVGEVRRISSAFSFYNGKEFFRDNIRVNAALEPAGCLGDLGWYCIRFALWAMNWRLPREVNGRMLSQPAREVADGIFRRADFRRQCISRILLFVSRRLQSMGFSQRAEGLAAAAGFRASVRQLSARVRGESARSSSQLRPEMPAESGPDGAGARDGAGHADVPQLCKSDFLRQAES